MQGDVARAMLPGGSPTLSRDVTIPYQVFWKYCVSLRTHQNLRSNSGIVRYSGRVNIEGKRIRGNIHKFTIVLAVPACWNSGYSGREHVKKKIFQDMFPN